jgi:hypothetical protein
MITCTLYTVPLAAVAWTVDSSAGSDGAGAELGFMLGAMLTEPMLALVLLTLPDKAHHRPMTHVMISVAQPMRCLVLFMYVR